MSTLVDRFRTQVGRSPDASALVWRRNEITYRQLYRDACLAQARLDGLGLAEGAPVGVLATKSPEAIALILALLADGRPFLLPAVGLAGDVLTALFAKAGCDAVLCTGTEPSIPATVIDQLPAPRADQLAHLPAGRDGIGFMLTTSGSTGMPKIVPLRSDGVDRFTSWAAGRFGIGPDRTVLNYAQLNFDLCLLDIWTTLSVGGRVVLVEPEHATRAAYLLDLLRRYRVNVVQAVPMFYQLLARHPNAGDVLTDADHVIFTGDVLPNWCLAELPRLFPRSRLYNLYGCTETNDSFLHEIDPSTRYAHIPLGEPISGVSAMLVGSDGSILDGTGVGELYVSTPFQSPGYLGEPGGAFVAHPTGADGRRYFRSRDLVRRNGDGSLTLEGRTDFQVKVRGVRVNPQEIERTLLKHDSVTDAVVFAIPDPLTGNALHAVIRRDRSRALNSLAVRRHCAEHLPRPAIPTGVHLVDEPFPMTSTGKPDRVRMRRAYLERTT